MKTCKNNLYLTNWKDDCYCFHYFSKNRLITNKIPAKHYQNYYKHEWNLPVSVEFHCLFCKRAKLQLSVSQPEHKCVYANKHSVFIRTFISVVKRGQFCLTVPRMTDLIQTVLVFFIFLPNETDQIKLFMQYVVLQKAFFMLLMAKKRCLDENALCFSKVLSKYLWNRTTLSSPNCISVYNGAQLCKSIVINTFQK